MRRNIGGASRRDPDTDPHYGRNATNTKTNYYICKRCGFHLDKLKHPRRNAGNSHNYFTTSIDVFAPGTRDTGGKHTGSDYLREV